MLDVSRNVERALDTDDFRRALVVAKVHKTVRATSDEIIARVGTPFCVRSVHELIGMARGQRRAVGKLVLAGVQIKWDYWFPHLGIAVDTREMPERVSDAKAAWAEAAGVLYFSPRVNAIDVTTAEGGARLALDLQGLAEAAAARRQLNQEGAPR